MTFTFCTFCDMLVCQRYKFYIGHATDICMHRYTNTYTHICRDTSTYTYRHMHTQTYRQTYISVYADIHRYTYIFFYINKHAYMNVRSILPAHFIFSCNLPNDFGSHGPIFIYLFTSLCLFCVHIVDMIEAVLGIYFHTSIKLDLFLLSLMM